MCQRDDCRRCESEVAESKPDVDQHEEYSYENCDNRLLSHLTRNNGTDILRCDCFFCNSKLLFESCIQCFALLEGEGLGLDDDAVILINLLGLDIVITGNLRNNRNNLLIDLSQAIILINLYGRGSTTKEFQAIIQRLTDIRLIHCHADEAGCNKCKGYTEEDSASTNKVHVWFLYSLSVELLITNADCIEGTYQKLGDYNCGKHGENNTESKGNCKSLNSTGSDYAKYSCCNQGSNVTIDNCGECLGETSFNRSCNVVFQSNLFLDTGEDNGIRINCHTNGEDDTCNTRKSKGDIKEIEDCKCYLCIEGKCHRCRKTRHAIYSDHEEHYDDKTNQRCLQGGSKCIRTELCTNDLRLDLNQIYIQTTDTDIGCKLFCFIDISATGNDAGSVHDWFINRRNGNELAVIVDTDRICNGIFLCCSCNCGCFTESFGTLLGEGQLNYWLLCLCGLICLIDTFCTLNIRTLEDNGAIFLQRLDCLAFCKLIASVRT